MFEGKSWRERGRTLFELLDSEEVLREFYPRSNECLEAGREVVRYMGELEVNMLDYDELCAGLEKFKELVAIYRGSLLCDSIRRR